MLLFFVLFWGFFFGRKACGILVPWPGIEPVPWHSLAVKAQSPNHWTAREFPRIHIFLTKVFITGWDGSLHYPFFKGLQENWMDSLDWAVHPRLDLSLPGAPTTDLLVSRPRIHEYYLWYKQSSWQYESLYDIKEHVGLWIHLLWKLYIIGLVLSSCIICVFSSWLNFFCIICGQYACK